MAGEKPDDRVARRDRADIGANRGERAPVPRLVVAKNILVTNADLRATR